MLGVLGLVGCFLRLGTKLAISQSFGTSSTFQDQRIVNNGLGCFLNLASLRNFGYKSSRITDSDLADAASFVTNDIHSYKAEASSFLFLFRTVICILQ